MTRTSRRWLLVEVLVAFGPAALMLFVGSTLGLWNAIEMARFNGPSELALLPLLVGGILGLTGVVSVMRWIYWRRPLVRGRVAVLLLLSGSVSVSVLLPYAWAERATPFVLVFALPLVVCLHLGYLARTHLFGHKESPADVAPNA